MSIFSSIKRSRQTAKKHKEAEQKKKEDEKKALPYKHIPTHAATDAFASAPPNWREDRERIIEENRRRSMINTHSYYASSPATPRVSSNLSSIVHFGPGSSRPTPPQAYNHAAASSTPTLFTGREGMYNVPQMAVSQPYSLKGKEAVRWPIYESPDQELDTSKDAQSVVDSSNESVSSRDNLEMRTRAMNTSVASTKTRNKRISHTPVTNRVPEVAPMAESSKSAKALKLAEPTQEPTLTSRDSSAASLPGLTPTSSRLPVSIPQTPVITEEEAAAFHFTPVEPQHITEKRAPSPDPQIQSTASHYTTAEPQQIEDKAIASLDQPAAFHFTTDEPQPVVQEKPVISANPAIQSASNDTLKANDVNPPPNNVVSARKSIVVNTFPQAMSSEPDTGKGRKIRKRSLLRRGHA